MQFEHYTQPILPIQKWIHRVIRSVWFAALFAGTALFIGILGYHFLDRLNWIDSLLEASMILAGMGPIAPLSNNWAKLFASAYALLSGFVIIGTTGIILGPWLHRMLHHFYYQERH